MELLKGLFWLPGRQEEAVPGELALGAEGPRLALEGMLTPYLRKESEHTAQDGSTLSKYVPTMGEDEPFNVHGRVEKGVGAEPVTAVDCYTLNRGNNPLVSGVGRHQLHALYVVRGAHVEGKDQRYTGFRVRFRHIDEWAGLLGFGHSFGADQASLTFEQPNVTPVALEGGGQLDLEQVLSLSLSEVRGGSLTRTVWMRVVDLQPARWREFGRDLITPLSTLLTLAVGVECPPVEVEVAIDAHSDWLPIHSSGLKPPADRPLPVESMLLPLSALGLAPVAVWLGQVEKLGPLPPVVAAAVAGPPWTLETSVLELTTVAEGLARRLWPEWERMPKHKADRARESALQAVAEQENEVQETVKGALGYLEEPSYPQRLERLAIYAREAVPGVTGRPTDEGRPSRWKKVVVDARNDFAHRIDRGWLGDDRIDPYLAVRTSLRWLLTGVLLLETGLPATVLATRLGQHQRYVLFLQQARDWLPSVYAQPSSGDLAAGGDPA